MDRQAPIEPPRSLRIPNPARETTAAQRRYEQAQHHLHADLPRSNFGPQSSQPAAVRRPLVPPIPTPGSAPDHPAEVSPPNTMTTTTFRLDGFTGMFLLRLMQEKPGGPGPPDHLRGELAGEAIEAKVLMPHVGSDRAAVTVEHGGNITASTPQPARTEKRRRDDERGKAPSAAGRKMVRFA
ncbi:hypothetical protein BFW01_g10256 [Lasiodiplodia theobromae]|uniref:Uncharacterized protein n=1 Tax=Lasiodiplodia theobromae TaxID=45133 RepID=A0A8H7INK1_9PEZI|nr:hypothetical protein BFW01_g10256 [Lasiodiplodia theobromae]